MLGDEKDIPFSQKRGEEASKEEVLAIKYDGQQDEGRRERIEVDLSDKGVEHKCEIRAEKGSGWTREEGSEEEEAWGNRQKFGEKLERNPTRRRRRRS